MGVDRDIYAACRISADESQDQFSGTRGWPSSKTRAWGGGFPAAACSSIRLVQLPVKTLPHVSRSPRRGSDSARHWSVRPPNMAAGMRMRGHSRARPTTRRQLARFLDRGCATSPRPLDDGTLAIPSWGIVSARREAAFGSPDLYEYATRSALASEGWVNNRRLPAIREASLALNAASGGLPRGKPASARMRPGCSPLRSPRRASECATTFLPLAAARSRWFYSLQNRINAGIFWEMHDVEKGAEGSVLPPVFRRTRSPR